MIVKSKSLAGPLSWVIICRKHVQVVSWVVSNAMYLNLSFFFLKFGSFLLNFFSLLRISPVSELGLTLEWHLIHLSLVLHSLWVNKFQWPSPCTVFPALLPLCFSINMYWVLPPRARSCLHFSLPLHFTLAYHSTFVLWQWQPQTGFSALFFLHKSIYPTSCETTIVKVNSIMPCKAL